MTLSEFFGTAILICLFSLPGYFIGEVSGKHTATDRLRQEAIDAGVAEWVTISDPFSSSKPVLEFRFKTPATAAK